MNSTLVITAPAENTQLATLDRIKQELGITGTDTDTLLSAKIDEASSDIAVRVRPSLGRQTITETFYRDSRPSEPERLFLRRWPVVSIVSVTIDGAETLDTAHYRFDPEIGVVYRLTESGYPRRWWCRKSIAIEYVAGYLLPADDGRDLPASLEAACIDLVASYWASRGRDPALRSESIDGVASFSYWVGAIGQSGDLPPSVMAKIKPFMVG